MFLPCPIKTTMHTPLAVVVAGIAGVSVAKFPGAIAGMLICLGAGAGGFVASLKGYRLAQQNLSEKELLENYKIDFFAKASSAPIAAFTLIELIWAKQSSFFPAMGHLFCSIGLGSVVATFLISKGIKASLTPDTPSETVISVIDRITCIAYIIAAIGGAIASPSDRFLGTLTPLILLYATQIAATDISRASRNYFLRNKCPEKLVQE